MQEILRDAADIIFLVAAVAVMVSLVRDVFPSRGGRVSSELAQVKEQLQRMEAKIDSSAHTSV